MHLRDVRVPPAASADTRRNARRFAGAARRRSLALSCVSAAAIAVGCSDGGASPTGAPDRGGEDAVASDLGPDVAEDDATDPRPDVDGGDEPDAPADGGDDTDAADGEPEAGDCGPGQRECADERFRRVCDGDGTWQLEACDADAVCEGAGNCVPVEEPPCTEGAVQCVGDEPSRCVGGELVGLGRCGEDLACVGGECVSRACAAAARSGSYLGCEYLATPLPNLAWSSFGGTPEAPLGIVLTNASDTEPVRAWVLNSDGETITDLVGEVTIRPPALGGAGDAEPVTVSSETYDRRGVLVEAGIERADGVTIPAGGMGIFLVEQLGRPTTTSVHDSTYWVRTDAPVAAYQFGPYCCNFSFSNDASLLYPTSSLGTEHVFIGIPSWAQADEPGGGTGGTQIPNTLTVLGTRDGTIVTVELPEGVMVADGADGADTSGGQVRATVNAGQVLTVYGAVPRTDRSPILGTDLSGSRVTSSAPVALFSGHECTFYPWDQGACDHVEEQLLPVDTWGRSFALVPPRLRTRNPDSASETTFWKIVADADGTEIELGAAWSSLDASPPGFAGVPNCGNFVVGGDRIELDAGGFCEFGTRRAFTLTASDPIMVMGIMSGADSVGFGAAAAGDPAIWVVPPRRQYRTEYAFLTPTTYALDYVTVTAQRGTVVILDGQPVDMTRAASIAGGTDVYVDVVLDDGPHRILGEQPIGILAYAYDEWVSYAFTGGLNLLKE